MLPITLNVVHMMSSKVFYISAAHFANDGGVNYALFEGYNDNILNSQPFDP